MKSYEKEYRHCLENSNKMELVDKIIYDEKELERKAKESEKYFKLWHEEKVKNNKAIEILENYVVHYRAGELYLKDILLDILKGVDKE